MPPVLVLLSLLAFASCGGGGPNLAGGGAGGAGIGPVSGFGSVIVNGVRFDDAGIPAAQVLDERGRTKGDLKVGMMVAVSGSIGGASGRADNMAILRHVDGPMDDNGVDLASGGLTVMGQDVRVDASTVFDNAIASLEDLRTLQGGNIRHPELEVHGASDDNGVIHATFIHKWADDRVTGRDVQVRGAVTGPITATTFAVGRKTVDYSGVAGGLPAGVAAGSFVEVKGTLRAADNVLVASGVRLEDATGGQPSGALAEVEGFIIPAIVQAGGSGSFALLGPIGVQTVTWTAGTTAFQGGAQADILAGVKVEVEGVRKADRSLAATRISFRRANNIRLESVATSVTAVSLALFGKTVKVNGLTQYEDSRDGLKTFGQANIAVNDTLKVSAFLDASTSPASIVAARVERIAAIDPDRHILQGPVDSSIPGGPNLVILGDLTVLTSPGATVFLDAEGGAMSQAAFFQVLEDDRSAGRTSVVRARGNAPTPTVVMMANEVRIEPTGAN
jgi:hypothetical protein